MTSLPRLPLHTLESAPEASRANVERAQRNNGFLPNLIGVLAHSPQALETYLGVSEINSRTSLTLAEREVVQLTAARIHGCEFCVAGHTAVALKKAGLTADQVRSLHTGAATGDARLDALQAFAGAVIATRGAVPDAALQQLLAAGFDQRQALEVVLGISLATLCNFANSLAQSPINEQLQAYRPAALAVPDAPAHDAQALRAWIDEHADALDSGARTSDLPRRIADAGLLRRGVPAALGGDGGTVADAVEAIASVAEHSLTAAFVFWGQRASIEYLVATDNDELRRAQLPALLSGQQAGATGLSNAIKFLSGIEPLSIQARQEGAGWVVQGHLPWATNLDPQGFTVAVALTRTDGGPPLVAALPSSRAGLSRGADLDLIALRGSHTASLRFDDVQIGPQDLLADDALRFLPQVRPAFLGLQCGLSIGLARASLRAARERAAGARPVLQPALDQVSEALEQTVSALHAGLLDGRWVAQPAPLFRLRVRLSELVQQAVQLELQASGGRAYHRDQPLGFARRWREAAFIPVITPSITQLQSELHRQVHGTVAAAQPA